MKNLKINDNVTTSFGNGKIKEIKLYNKKVYYVIKMDSDINLILRDKAVSKV